MCAAAPSIEAARDRRGRRLHTERPRLLVIYDAIVVGAGLSGLVYATLRSEPRAVTTYDAIVVGAGLSGLVCATLQPASGVP